VTGLGAFPYAIDSTMPKWGPLKFVDYALAQKLALNQPIGTLTGKGSGGGCGMTRGDSESPIYWLIIG